MSKDLFMVCWMGLISAVMWQGSARSLPHIATILVCLISASLEAGNEEGEAQRAKYVARSLACLAFLACLATEAYFGTSRFLR